MRGMALGWICGALAVACAGGDEPAPSAPFVAPAEAWQFSFDGRAWEPASKVRTKILATETYVLPGQNENTWTELVSTALTFGAQRSTDVFAVAESTRKMLEKDCPTFKWDYLEQSQKSVIYEWSRSLCKDVQPQHEISRLTTGRIGIHKLTYAAKSPQIAPGLRRQWLKLIGDATLQLRGPESGAGAAPDGDAAPDGASAPAAP